MNETLELLPDIKLRFNIEHPSFEECYAHGYECGQAQINEEDNPFRIGSKESEQWLEGWWAGFYGEEPLFEIECKNQTDENPSEAANDQIYHASSYNFFAKVLEFTGVLAVSATLGYQVIDLVA